MVSCRTAIPENVMLQAAWVTETLLPIGWCKPKIVSACISYAFFFGLLILFCTCMCFTPVKTHALCITHLLAGTPFHPTTNTLKQTYSAHGSPADGHGQPCLGWPAPRLHCGSCVRLQALPIPPNTTHIQLQSPAAADGYMSSASLPPSMLPPHVTDTKHIIPSLPLLALQMVTGSRAWADLPHASIVEAVCAYRRHPSLHNTTQIHILKSCCRRWIHSKLNLPPSLLPTYVTDTKHV